MKFNSFCNFFISNFFLFRKFEDNGSELDDSDDDEDDINVVIGDIKSGTQSYNIKTQPLDNKKIAGGKFNIEEFESVGTINGTAAHEFQIESIEDKPWRKPGADITDYFNYGFNEDTWRAYCERQKKMRVHESGIGLAGLTAAVNNQSGNPEGHHRHGISIGIRRPGPPRKPVGSIDVIGGGGSHPPRRDMNDMGMGMIRPPTPRENVIQVMTADRREYSRTVVGNNNPNMPPPPMQMQFNVAPEEYYNHEADNAFNYGYEPTQDSQWDPQNSNPGWAPGVKELTPGISRPPPMIPPPMGMQQLRMPMGMPPMMQQQGDGPPIIPPLMGQMNQIPPKMVPQPLMSSSDKNRDKDREKNDDSRRRSDYEERRKMRERSSSKDREKDRQNTRKTERSESRYRDSNSRRDTRKERSRSREKSRRRSREKSRDKDKDRKDRRDKKKSHKKDKDESE